MTVTWKDYCRGMRRLGYRMENKAGSVRNFVSAADPFPIQVHVPHNSKKRNVYPWNLKKTCKRLGMPAAQFIEFCRSA